MYNGYTEDPNVTSDRHARHKAQQAARRMVELIGYKSFVHWLDQHYDNDTDCYEWETPLQSQDWGKLAELLNAEIDRLTVEECDCNGANRDSCPACRPVVDPEAMLPC